MSPVMSIVQIVLMLWDLGAIVIEDTFDTRYHKSNPDAPASPWKVNMRMAPDGPLEWAFIFEIGRHMADHLLYQEIRLPFDGIFGIPRAGEVLVEGFVREWPAMIHAIHLNKIEEGGDRRFELVPDPCPLQVKTFWGVDDVAHSILTKELVKRALAKPLPGRPDGMIVLGFSVLIERSDIARKAMHDLGLALVSSATTQDVIKILVDNKRLSATDADRFLAVDAAYNCDMLLRMTA